ncbi:MAG: DUF362 domain-containing protein, partial [Candidatus Aminicenantes bacterium]
GFTARPGEPGDQEVCDMIDEIILQVLGPEGLAAIIKPGDKVVIKVNNVSPHRGRTGEKGRGIITDPRITRYVAEKVRSIIGYDNTADLKVTDAVYTQSPNPSARNNYSSFYYARLERTGDDQVNPEDICCDYDADGILDGGSNAQLVNLDSIDESGRFLETVYEPSLGAVDVYLPKFLRTREQAEMAGEPDNYCDVFIGLPIFKNHSLAGITGAIKLHYGLRYYWTFPGETGRPNHSGLTYDSRGIYNPHYLDEYLCAQHQVRTYDFIIMDCLTGNRRGPLNNSEDNMNSPTDYILTNALLGSKDPIAIDTAAALFAGYNLDTVEFLERGRLDGLGTNQPEYIRLIGLTAFTSHRQSLYDTYHPQRLYPFENGWGQAHVMSDFDPPTDVTVSAPTQVNGSTYSFDYSAHEDQRGDLGLARIEFLVNGELVAYKNTDLNSDGTIEVDLNGFDLDTLIYRIAVWDKALNCALSEEKMFNGQTPPQPPEILEHPVSTLVFEGRSTALEVIASSDSPIRYQWRKDGVDIPGANASTYVIQVAANSDEGVYTCLVSNDAGYVESNTATLFVVDRIR